MVAVGVKDDVAHECMSGMRPPSPVWARTDQRGIPRSRLRARESESASCAASAAPFSARGRRPRARCTESRAPTRVSTQDLPRPPSRRSPAQATLRHPAEP